VSDQWEQPSSDAVVGEAAEGRVRVVLNAAGLVQRVDLADDVVQLPVRQLGSALTAALQQAQAAVAARAGQAAAAYGGLPSRARLEAASQQASAEAERRFGEISTVLYDLDRRAGRER
jgi:DNA-binding protein YbaB